MRYISTRNRHYETDFADAFLQGLAPDGGLFVPKTWPVFSAQQWRAFRDLPYDDLAFHILEPYVATALPAAALRDIVARAYAPFHHPGLAPLTQIAHQTWLLELFHGPTMAFKDFGLQFLGQCLAYLLRESGQRLNIIGATSGDTGSAAIAACRGIAGVNIFILHPHEKISPIQRRQMTTTNAANVFNLAVRGNFDDCQHHVKSLFNDASFRQTYPLTAVNSINWGRIAAQIVYYAYAALALGAPDRTVNFVVPSGNFGNVFAAYCAKKMGLPIGKLVLATNQNDILHRFIQHNDMRKHAVVPSLAPSMDIQTSSNFERLAFCYTDHDDRAIRQATAALADSGHFPISPGLWQAIRQEFASARVDDAAITDEIARVHRDTGMVIDPHSAIATRGARDIDRDTDRNTGPMVCLATAHAAKFPDAIVKAIGTAPALPPHQAHLLTQDERFHVTENTLPAISAYIAKHALQTA